MSLSDLKNKRLPKSKSNQMVPNLNSNETTTDATVLNEIQNQIETISLNPKYTDIPSISPISNKEINFIAELADSVSTDKTDCQDDFGKYIPEGCLFVASLVSSRTEEQLQESVREHFKQWGDLENVKVLKDPKNRPYSFVQFKSPESAAKALVEAVGSLVDGRPIRVERAKVNRTFYIGKISEGANERMVRESLATFGPIDEFHFVQTAGETDIYNRCVIKYRYREDAIAAFTSIKKDDVWSVKWENNEDKDAKKYDLFSIFVGNLNPKTIEVTLRNRFEQYGKIESLSLITKPFDSYKYAFIKYSSKESCRKALEEDGNMWFDKNIKVAYKELKPVNPTKTNTYNGFTNRRLSCVESNSHITRYNALYPQYIIPTTSVQASIGNLGPRFFPVENRAGIEGIFVPLEMLSKTEGYKTNSRLKKF